jgi:hypothetical protein
LGKISHFKTTKENYWNMLGFVNYLKKETSMKIQAVSNGSQETSLVFLPTLAL